tara:strand:- start:958 stop:1077 length:120 start_codon:yes stop_codon:yes gene_type:complete
MPHQGAENPVFNLADTVVPAVNAAVGERGIRNNSYSMNQ